jgi:hypothetical protein
MRRLAMLALFAACSSADDPPARVVYDFRGDPGDRTLTIEGQERTRFDTEVPDQASLEGLVIRWQLASDQGVLVDAGETPFEYHLIDLGFPQKPITEIDVGYCLAAWGTYRLDYTLTLFEDGGRDFGAAGCAAPCLPFENQGCAAGDVCGLGTLAADPRYHELACRTASQAPLQLGDPCTRTGSGWLVDDCDVGLVCLDGTCQPACSVADGCAATCATPVGYPPEIALCPP